MKDEDLSREELLELVHGLRARIRSQELGPAEERLFPGDIPVRYFSMIFELMRDGVVGFDRHGRIVFANPAMGLLTGRSVEELIGKTAREAWDERESSDPRFRTGTSMEVTLVRADGHRRHATRKVFPITDTPQLEVAIYRDITRRKKAEDSLRREEAFHRSLLENSSDYILVVDGDRICRNLLPAAAALPGRTREQIIGAPIGDVLDAGRNADFHDRLEDGIEDFDLRFDTGELELGTEDGDVRYFEGVVRNHLNDGVVKSVIITLRETTHQHHGAVLQSTLRQLGESLQLASTVSEAGRLVFEAADKLFGWDAAFLSVFDPESAELKETTRLVYDIIDGKRQELPPEIPNKKNKATTLFEGSGEHAKLINYPEPPKEPGLVPFGDCQRFSRCKMLVLLRDRRGKRIGLLSIQSYTPSVYTNSSLEKFQILADYCAATIARTQAEEALRHRESLYRRVIAQADAVAYERETRSRRLLFMDPGIHQMIGYGPEELVPETWKKISKETVFQGDEAGLTVREGIEKFNRGEMATWRSQMRVVARDGTERWLADSSVAIFDEEGFPARSLGILQDITHHKKAEARQRRQAELLRGIVEIADELLGIGDLETFYRRAVELPRERLGVDRCGLFLRDGDVYRGTYGTTADGKTSDERGHQIRLAPAEIEKFEKHHSRRVVIHAPRSSVVGEKVVYHDEGWIAQTPLLHEKERLVGCFYNDSLRTGAQYDEDLQNVLSVYCSMLCGMIARKRTETALAQSEASLNAILESLPALVWTTDTNLAVRTTAGSLMEDLGAQPGDYRGLTVGEYDRSRDLGGAILRAHEKALGGEIVSFVQTSRAIVLSIRLSPLADASGNVSGVLGLALDVTKEHQAAEEHRRFEERVQRAQKLESLGVLAGGIAHDFNNLLSGVLGYATLATDQVDRGHPVRRALEGIEDAANRMADLTRQMLAYAGRGQFVREPVDMNHVVTELLDLLKVGMTRDTELHLDLSTQRVLVEGDRDQLHQVVVNLVTNASEALEDKAGTIRIATGQAVFGDKYALKAPCTNELEAGRYVFLEVEDTGVGMDADTVARVFEPFFSTKFPGRGLGLAAVHGIIQAHGGGVEARSVLGSGSTFRVYLPLLASEGVSPRGNVEEKRPGAPQADAGHVLVIDDERTVREVAGKVLEQHGIPHFLAEDGERGVDVFREHHERIAAVLLDLTMPRMGGLEVFHALYEIDPDIPVILMSGYSEEDVRRRFHDKPVAGFLAKPFLPSDLIRLLKQKMP